MKNLIKKSMVIVVMFTALLVNANEISSLRNLNDEKTTMLTLLNVKKGNQLYIKDVFGLVLYKESIKGNGEYVKGFDLTSLPDGEYFFEIDKDLEITIIPFEVKMSIVEFNKEMEKTIYKPYISKKGNRILISKLSLNKQPLKVKIYFDYNSGSYDLVHTETIQNTMNIHKAFETSKKGSYKIVLETEGRSFTEYLDGSYNAYQSTKRNKNEEKLNKGSKKLVKNFEDKILNLKGDYFTKYNNRK